MVDGFNHLENILVNGKDYPIYMDNKKVPNHQPYIYIYIMAMDPTHQPQKNMVYQVTWPRKADQPARAWLTNLSGS